MAARLGALLLAAGASGCLRYEFDHEFWLRTDGAGSVRVTGRPALWVAFKGLPDADDEVRLLADARRAFERSGLEVRRSQVTTWSGRRYLSVTAEFKDVNRLSATPAFPDLTLQLQRVADRLNLEGEWRLPTGSAELASRDRDGLAAIRFHLPSKVYAHRNAADGVERGNILTWRTELPAVGSGRALAFGASLGQRSILVSTLWLFAAAIGTAVATLVTVFALVRRRGRASEDQLQQPAR